MQPLSEEELTRTLEWGLSAAGTPAMLAIFQPRVDAIEATVAACRRVSQQVEAVDTRTSGGLSSFLRGGECATHAEIEILVGGLSSVPHRERSLVNSARDRILRMGRKLVFVEPSSLSEELHRDFPDIFACVRQQLMLQDLGDDDDELFDSGGARRFATLARRMPSLVVKGATLIEQGRVHFKSPPAISCPRCGRTLKPGLATIDFLHAPEATRRQEARAWVCPCGEAYIPGEAARDAHARAFASSARP